MPWQVTARTDRGTLAVTDVPARDPAEARRVATRMLQAHGHHVLDVTRIVWAWTQPPQART